MKKKIVKALFKILAGDVVDFKKFKERKVNEPIKPKTEIDPVQDIMQRNMQNKERMKRDREKANESVKRSYRLKETQKVEDLPSWLKSKDPQVKLACDGDECLLFDIRTKYFYLKKGASKKTITKKQVTEWLDAHEDLDSYHDKNADMDVDEKLHEIARIFFGQSSGFA